MTSDITEPIIIAVCGGTGVGKSTFINDASGGNLLVGHMQKSCTETVQLAPLFELEGRDIQLVDTPGFDDSTMTDSEILKRLASFLKTTYHQDQLLSGIIYMHRISDNRVGGASRRNFNVFRKLCGEGALRNVVVTTSMWSNPPTEIEIARERELGEEELFFKPILSKGARTARYIRGQGVGGAHDIIRMFVANTVLPVQLQTEQERGISLGKTAAGQALGEELAKLALAQQTEIAEVQQDMRDEYVKQDVEARQELEDYKRQAEKHLASIQAQLDKLKQELNSERDRREKLEEEYRAEYQKHLAEQIHLKAKYERLKEESEGATGEERDRIEEEMKKTKDRVRVEKLGFWARVAKFFREKFS
ncbi:hypothetical protein BDV93DRAFT_604752 [Ceratobasidium sp. AG-I]|nr:hypothetical protein BDV93DRAFT_604752 [Ceratobasidium sp. AG-I]